MLMKDRYPNARRVRQKEMRKGKDAVKWLHVRCIRACPRTLRVEEVQKSRRNKRQFKPQRTARVKGAQPI